MIIQSLLDTDLYKFTMQQAVWSQFPHAHVEYTFKCRDTNVDLRPYADEIRDEIEQFCRLSLTQAEIAYLKTIRFLRSGYVDSLRGLTMEAAAVKITTDPEFALHIEGNWYQTILFEVPILAIINEVYFRNTQPNAPERDNAGRERLMQKCEQMESAPLPLHVMEFGTRRRYSREWQREVVSTLQQNAPRSLIGTSNVGWAKEFGLKPFGTMAHEFLQAGQAFAPVPDSQKFAFEAWMQEYRGDLGIALSDVFGMDAFFHDFDLLFSKAYDGARHDSGDPFDWCEKLIAHYERMGIDPRLKTAVFSDGLDISRCLELAQRFEGRIRLQFGIGTNLTNDLGFKALQIVLKMTRCNGRPVVKLSDTPGKTMSDNPVYLQYVLQTFGRTE